MTNVSEDSVIACANCGKPLQFDVDYPVTTRTVEGEFELHSFCDETCRDEWGAGD